MAGRRRAAGAVRAAAGGRRLLDLHARAVLRERDRDPLGEFPRALRRRGLDRQRRLRCRRRLHGGHRREVLRPLAAGQPAAGGRGGGAARAGVRLPVAQPVGHLPFGGDDRAGAGVARGAAALSPGHRRLRRAVRQARRRPRAVEGVAALLPAAAGAGGGGRAAVAVPALAAGDGAAADPHLGARGRILRRAPELGALVVHGARCGDRGHRRRAAGVQLVDGVAQQLHAVDFDLPARRLGGQPVLADGAGQLRRRRIPDADAGDWVPILYGAALLAVVLGVNALPEGWRARLEGRAQ